MGQIRRQNFIKISAKNVFELGYLTFEKKCPARFELRAFAVSCVQVTSRPNVPKTLIVLSFSQTVPIFSLNSIIRVFVSAKSVYLNWKNNNFKIVVLKLRMPLSSDHFSSTLQIT